MSGPHVSTTPQSISQAGYVTKYVWDENNLIYMGKAPPGTSVSDSLWQIRKFTWGVDGNISDKQWAGGNDSFKSAWSDYLTLTYS